MLKEDNIYVFSCGWQGQFKLKGDLPGLYCIKRQQIKVE
jgi:hypothetical protein